MYLHDYSDAVHLQKEKHLKVIGTPVGCLSQALRCLIAGWGSRLLMCTVTGFTSGVSEKANPGRVQRLPRRNLLIGSSRVNRIRFRRLDIFDSI
ncbi:hypothetical protein TIFTF001_014003 [Ficus carica]|uniref:Uncharacterized protein n=1 Tax=Ficus carica TaxID=3494 RepID=A0AA88A4H7_FICCA|nr:hypothetical protein TIFTF001_014003 [Ficus carica]